MSTDHSTQRSDAVQQHGSVVSRDAAGGFFHFSSLPTFLFSFFLPFRIFPLLFAAQRATKSRVERCKSAVFYVPQCFPWFSIPKPAARTVVVGSATGEAQLAAPLGSKTAETAWTPQATATFVLFGC